MRIALVSEHASPLAVLGGVDAGGQNVHVAALAAALGRRRAEVVVYTRRDDPTLPVRVSVAPHVTVEHIDAGPPHAISKDLLLPHMHDFAAELARRWRVWRPDVVHAHFWMSGRAAIAAARPLGIPVLQTFHALGIVKRRYQGANDTSPAERLHEECAVIRAADAIVATCSDEVAELGRLGADLGRVRVVPCGVDLSMFRPEGPVEPRRWPHRVVCVSRLVERKGIADVIAALVDVPDTELVVAGGPAAAELASDSEARRLQALAERIGVAARVEFRGRVDQASVPALLRSADVVACVPWYEPFGIVPLEAMACGVPVVASGVGGLLDTVVDGVAGVHVPPRDATRLADVLRELLADGQRRARLGAAGAARAHVDYGWERVAAATLDAYRTVLSRTRAQRRRAGVMRPVHATPIHGVTTNGRTHHNGAHAHGVS
jgi:D-inositol-3-phosphate glycosyltransferase